MDWAELIMRRKNVSEFVRTAPVSIEITRTGKPVRTPGGGKLPGESKKLAKQTVRIVQNVRRYTAGLVNAETGDIPNGLYVLIARHTADVERDDIFEAEGERYIVLGVSQLRRKEYVLATLDFYGPPNTRASSPNPPTTHSYPPPVAGMAIAGISALLN